MFRGTFRLHAEEGGRIDASRREGIGDLPRSLTKHERGGALLDVGVIRPHRDQQRRPRRSPERVLQEPRQLGVPPWHEGVRLALGGREGGDHVPE